METEHTAGYNINKCFLGNNFFKVPVTHKKKTLSLELLPDQPINGRN